MWFKNLRVYKLAAVNPFTAMTEDEVKSELFLHSFKGCDPMQLSSTGWTLPTDNENTIALYRQNAILLALRTDEKVLPASAVKAALADKVASIEKAEARKVSSKERKLIKDQVTDEMLPKAFVKSRIDNVLIDLENNLVIVNTASASNAERVLSFLRETMGNLPTKLVNTVASPIDAMTSWLEIDAPDGWSVGQDAEMKAPGDEGTTAKFKRQVLDCDEIFNHLAAGKVVTKLEMNFGDRLSFNLCEDFGIKSLKMLDVVKDEVKDMDAEDQDALFESQLALMIGELRGFIPALIEALGGEQK